MKESRYVLFALKNAAHIPLISHQHHILKQNFLGTSIFSCISFIVLFVGLRLEIRVIICR